MSAGRGPLLDDWIGRPIALRRASAMAQRRPHPIQRGQPMAPKEEPMWNGSPGTSSRIATALPNPVAQANAKAAAPSARSGLSVTRPSRSRRAFPVWSYRGLHSCRQHDHSARSNDAVGVRAAMRPGNAATTLASVSAPKPDEDHRQGRDGWLGYDVDLLGEQIPEEAAQGDPQRHPHDGPRSDGHPGLPSDDGSELASGEPRVLKRARSRRRRRTEASNVSPRAITAAAPSAAPSSAGWSPWSGS